MELAIKNYKPAYNLSEETIAFTASLYIDGKKAADVSNHGQGGPNMYHFKDRDLEQKFYEHCKTFLWDTKDDPQEWMHDLHGKPKDPDSVIDDLCQEIEHQKWLKRQTRNAVLFRLMDSGEGEYQSIKFRKGRPKDEERVAIRKHIEDTYGDRVVEVVA